MKRFVVAISFLTRIPIPPNLIFEAKDVGRATLVFPLVGALLGLIQVLFLKAFEFGGFFPNSSLKVALAAILLVIVSAFLTGALHFDGLADMFDGFGGGHDKKNILRIMRDSVIGTYGATALFLLILLKVTAIAALIETGEAWKFLIVAPVFGRWATVPLGKFMSYARASGGLGASVTDFVGWTELVGASVCALIFTFALLDWRSAVVCWLIVIFLTIFNARLCKKKNRRRDGRHDGREYGNLRSGSFGGSGFSGAMKNFKMLFLVCNRKIMNLPEGVTNRIVLVRHGEPLETARGRCYGRLDVGLSDNGRRQIEKACEFLQNFEFSAVYASPRIRARESAQIIAAQSELFYETKNDFAEIDFGDFENLTYEEIEQKFPGSYRQWMETPTKVEFPNGESFVRMQTRVLRAAADLRARHTDETVLIIAHGGVNRIILAHFLRMNDEDIFRLEQNYASASVIDFYGEFPLVKIMNHGFQ